MSARKKKKKQKQAKRQRLPRASRPLSGPFANSIIIEGPPGAEKMSEVLAKFIEPYSEHWETVEGLKKVLSVATVAWNAALLPAAERVKVLQKIVEAVPLELREGMRAIAQDMIERKLTHFASNTRAIISYEVTMTPSGNPYVSVMSSLPG